MQTSDQGAIAVRPCSRAHRRLTAVLAALALIATSVLGVTLAPPTATPASGSPSAFTAASWDAA